MKDMISEIVFAVFMFILVSIYYHFYGMEKTIILMFALVYANMVRIDKNIIKY